MSKNTRATDFRYVYSNGLKIQFTPNEVMLLFGMREDYTSPEEILREEIGIVLGLSTAKLLGETLNRTIQHFEATTNTQIPIDPAKLEALENLLKVASDQAKASSTS